MKRRILPLATVFSSLLLSACGRNSGSSEPPVVEEVNYTPYACDEALYDKANNLRIYHMMTEAFIDGDTNRGYGIGYGPSHHNGDLRGVINALDYIKSLGMNAIWLTPIFESAPLDNQGYSTTQLDATGYFGSNYFAIDPRFGSMDDARELVEQAHARGLYVFFDAVFGHHKVNAPDYPSPNGLTLSGEGPTYSFLDTTRKSVFPTDLDFMKEVAVYWINELKIDGWRLDVADEVPVGAWGEIRQLVEQTSQSVSYEMNGETVNPLGYMVAEIWDGGGDKVRSHGYGPEEQPGVCSAFDFAMRYKLVQVLAAEESGQGSFPATYIDLGWSLNSDNPSHAHTNLFISNHDLVRLGDLIQRAGYDQSEYWLRHKAIYSFVAAFTGPITLYYGDEIGDEVPNFDIRNSQCDGVTAMCDDHAARTYGKVEGLPAGDDRTPFSASADQADLRSYIRNLMTLRAAHPALYNGERTRLRTSNDELLYADLKVADSERILYLLNVADTAQSWNVLEAQLEGATLLRNLQTGEEVALSGGLFELTAQPLAGAYWQVL